MPTTSTRDDSEGSQGFDRRRDVGWTRSLHAIAVEHVVLGAIDVIVLLDTFDILDGLNLGMGESTIDLLAIVDWRVEGTTGATSDSWVENNLVPARS